MPQTQFNACQFAIGEQRRRGPRSPARWQRDHRWYQMTKTASTPAPTVRPAGIVELEIDIEVDSSIEKF